MGRLSPKVLGGLLLAGEAVISEALRFTGVELGRGLAGNGAVAGFGSAGGAVARFGGKAAAGGAVARFGGKAAAGGAVARLGGKAAVGGAVAGLGGKAAAGGSVARFAGKAALGAAVVGRATGRLGVGFGKGRWASSRVLS